MYPSSSPVAKTLTPSVATENQMAEQLSRRLRAAAQKMQRQGLDYKDLVAKDSGELLPVVMFYRMNRDGSVVTLDSAGRATSLENGAGKKVYSYIYNSAKDREPIHIVRSDGCVFEKRIDVDLNGNSHTVWQMKSPSSKTASLEFPDSVLTIGRDGSFTIKYKCVLASSIKRDDVVREINFNARGKKVIELVKTTCNRVGPGNSITVKEIYVRQTPLEIQVRANVKCFAPA